MTPLDIIQYVFQQEQVDLELKNISSRKTKLVNARYISIYLINWFFPTMKANIVMGYFKINRSGFYHALITVKDLIQTDRKFEDKIARYIGHISNFKSDVRPFVVKGNTITKKLLNRRITLKKTNDIYSINIKRLKERKIEEMSFSLTHEAMDSLMDAYNILRK